MIVLDKAVQVAKQQYVNKLVIRVAGEATQTSGPARYINPSFETVPNGVLGAHRGAAIHALKDQPISAAHVQVKDAVVSLRLPQAFNYVTVSPGGVPTPAFRRSVSQVDTTAVFADPPQLLGVSQPDGRFLQRAGTIDANTRQHWDRTPTTGFH